MALGNVKSGSLLNDLEVTAASEKVAEVATDQDHGLIMEINEHLVLTAHAQALQEPTKTEAHKCSWTKKDVYLKLNGAMEKLSWKMIGLLGESLSTGHARHELNIYG